MNDIIIKGGDLETANGDFVTGYSNEQHQEHLLVFQKGSLKGDPECGVGIENYLRDTEIPDMVREIRHQFERDGMNVNSVVYDEEQYKLSFDANYKS